MRMPAARVIGAIVVIAGALLLAVALLWPGAAPVVNKPTAASRAAENTDTRVATSLPTAATAITTTPFRGDTRPGNTARLTVRTVSQERRRPVADVNLVATITGGKQTRREARGTTDETGAWFVTVDAPCSVSVGLFPWGQDGAVVIAAGETEAALVVRVPWDNEIEGSVVNAAGAPVANAVILAQTGSTMPGVVVATTDALGAFHLSCVRPWRRLSAWHPREGPSQSQTVGPGRRETPVFRLQGASRVALEIRTADGAPVDAEVALGATDGGLLAPGHPIFWTTMRSPGGALSVRWPAGTLHYRVQGPGAAAATGTLELRSGETTKHVVRLSRDAELAGVVQSEAGVAIEGATIIAYAANNRARTDGTSDKTGAFHLVTPDGELTVRAWWNDGWEDRVRVPDGERAPISLRLFTGPDLRVTVVDEAMRPIAGALVAASRDIDGTSQVRKRTADADGVAFVPRLRAGALRLSARWPESSYDRVASVSTTVDADTTQVQLVLAQQAFGTVSGRVADEKCRSIGLGGGPDKRTIVVDVIDAAFRSPPLPPGEYTLTQRLGILPDWDSQRVRIEAGKDTNVGVLATPGFGLVKVTLDGDPADAETATITFSASGPRRANVTFSSSVALAYTATGWPVELPAGTWEVSLNGPRLLPSRGTLTLRPDATTTVTLPVTSGVPVSVRITFASPDDASDVDLQFNDAEHKLRRRERASPGYGDATARWEGVLPPGTWKIRGVSSDNRQATAERTLTLAEPGVTTIDLSFQPGWPADGEDVELDFAASEAIRLGTTRVGYVVTSIPGGVHFSGAASAAGGRCVATRKLPAGKYAVYTTLAVRRDHRTFTVVAGAGPTRVTFE